MHTVILVESDQWHVAWAWNLWTRLSTKYNTPDPLVAARILGKVGGEAATGTQEPAFATEHGANAAIVELSQAAACPP